jgi:pimeloyl-ACP methyl ester carboxylesterase
MRRFMIVLLLAAAALAQSETQPESNAGEGLRTMAYTPRSAQQAVEWQKELREKLVVLMKLEERAGAGVPLEPRVLSSEQHARFMLQEVEFRSTSGRRIKAIVTLPRYGPAPYPAVVCIHGHGGHRQTVYQPGIYRAFAAELAAGGYITVSTDVGQHEVFEPGRTLMGERLRDLIRSIDYLVTIEEVDLRRIGCAGLSLGGEMAMWLAAMDQRIAATVSSGFLTTMDQMEQNHCMCWKFPGLRELVDFADIYSLIAPRPLQCQNGLDEPAEAFTVPLARRAMEEIHRIYADLGHADKVELAVHPEGHVINLPGLIAFLNRHLKMDAGKPEAEQAGSP